MWSTLPQVFKHNEIYRKPYHFCVNNYYQIVAQRLFCYQEIPKI